MEIWIAYGSERMGAAYANIQLINEHRTIVRHHCKSKHSENIDEGVYSFIFQHTVHTQTNKNVDRKREKIGCHIYL